MRFPIMASLAVVAITASALAQTQGGTTQAPSGSMQSPPGGMKTQSGSMKAQSGSTQMQSSGSQMQSGSMQSGSMQHAGAMGMHTMPATVTSVDPKTGVTDVTSAGMTLKLHFPPKAVADLKAGDKITVHLAFTKP